MYINRFRFNFLSYRKVGSKVVSWKCVIMLALKTVSTKVIANIIIACQWLFRITHLR